jgi:hypothetical protein
MAVHIQIADLVLNILRNVALLQDFQNLQAQPCDDVLRAEGDRIGGQNFSVREYALAA